MGNMASFLASSSLLTLRLDNTKMTAQLLLLCNLIRLPDSEFIILMRACFLSYLVEGGCSSSCYGKAVNKLY